VAHIALVSTGPGGERGVICELAAAARHAGAEGRLRFVGPVQIDGETQRHANQVLLPLVDRILDCLQQGRADYDISVATPGAYAASGTRLFIPGLSADVPLLLALVSSSLKIPIAKGLMATGHIASVDGRVAFVQSLPAKLQAAAGDPRIERVLYPSPDADPTLASITPRERQRAVDALASVSDRLRTIEAQAVDDCVREAFEVEDILLASFHCGFFETRLDPESAQDAPVRVALHLVKDNEARFWSSLDRRLIDREFDAARGLLAARADFHILREDYPTGLGKRLFGVVTALPPAIRRLRKCFPLLSKRRLFELMKVGSLPDFDDMDWLRKAALGRDLPPSWPAKPTAAAQPQPSKDEKAVDAVLDGILEEISEEALATAIGIPIDNARATFALPSIHVDSQEEFHALTVGFYRRLVLHRDPDAVEDDETLADQAFRLLEASFRDEGGARGALREARDGVRGGVRRVLDQMTEQCKREQAGERVFRVFRDAYDALDWDERVAVTAALMKRMGPALPDDVRTQGPEAFADNLEELAREWVRAMDHVRRAFR